MIEPGRLRSARQNHGPFGQRDRRTPPRVVQQVGLGAGGDAGEDAAAGVELRAGRPVDRGRAAAGTSRAARGSARSRRCRGSRRGGRGPCGSRRRASTWTPTTRPSSSDQVGELGLVVDRDAGVASGPCAGRSRSRCPSRTSCGRSSRLTRPLDAATLTIVIGPRRVRRPRLIFRKSACVTIMLAGALVYCGCSRSSSSPRKRASSGTGSHGAAARAGRRAPRGGSRRTPAPTRSAPACWPCTKSRTSGPRSR